MCLTSLSKVVVVVVVIIIIIIVIINYYFYYQSYNLLQKGLRHHATYLFEFCWHCG